MADPIKSYPYPLKKIEGGKFKMGTLTGDTDEQPIRVIEMDAFLITTERVTSDQHRKFVKDYADKFSVIISGCADPSQNTEISAHSGESLYDFERRVKPLLDGNQYCAMQLKQTRKPNPAFLSRENQPYYDGSFGKGIALSYEEARGYCQNHGGDLPTAAQVEMEQRLNMAERKMDAEGFCEYNDDLTQWEWTRDAYQSDWYAQMPSKNPYNPKENPAAQGIELRRGPADFMHGGTRVGDRAFDNCEHSFGNVGFRCVFPVESK